MGVINKPNVSGVGCEYQETGLFLNGRQSRFGLPNNGHYTIGIEEPMVDLGPDTTLCFSNKLTLNAAIENATYLWQDGSTNPIFEVDRSGVYWVSATNACSSITDSINVDFSAPQVNLGKDTILCDNETILLDATHPQASYLWNDGSKDPTYLVSSPGLYWVEVNLGDCKIRDSILVNNQTALLVPFGSDTTVCNGEPLRLEAYNDGATYLWNDLSIDPYLVVTTSGIYSVEISNGCNTKYQAINVKFVDCTCNFFLPNAFSPNNDGLNDIYMPMINCPGVAFEIKIFNRWGELIGIIKNENPYWDGTFQQKMSPDGLYTYKLNYSTKKLGEVVNHSEYGGIYLIK